MDWFKASDISATDTYIGNDIYTGLVTQEEGIDLRQEMNWILYGKNTPPTRKPKGHWVVYRRFDRTKKSQYYSNRTHEGVGGPAYEYTDSLLRTRRVPIDRRGIPIDPLKGGIDLGDRYVYYLEYSVAPARGDSIYEIQWDDHASTPSNIDTLTLLERFTIMRTHGYRLEDGNVQYYLVSSEFDEARY